MAEASETLLQLRASLCLILKYCDFVRQLVRVHGRQSTADNHAERKINHKFDKQYVVLQQHTDCVSQLPPRNLRI